MSHFLSDKQGGSPPPPTAGGPASEGTAQGSSPQRCAFIRSLACAFIHSADNLWGRSSQALRGQKASSVLALWNWCFRGVAGCSSHWSGLAAVHIHSF